ncbi:MAG TPA: 4-hydroxy-tetrahydrodipicolinate synthase [Oligoflexia bacterium]|nr:4-hydroxy-tetrahydrodipicolinate synthase [Oligoflexia bacterium]HMP48867.1 4-hydroxy-tetrahydrodipicolinate synthase [Oligoflexia bacterium]
MFSGVITALVTPFISRNLSSGVFSYEIDWQSFENLIEWQLAEGIDGFVLYGTTGESATLSVEEKLEITRRTKDMVRGRVPLIVGAGTNSTEGTIRFIEGVKSLKPDGVLAVAPYYNRPSQEGMYQHFSRIAREGGLPVMLYNVPSRTASEISIETVKRLSEIDNIVAIKQASDSVSNLGELCSALSGSKKVSVMSGEDTSTLYTMLVGGSGVVSACANCLPREMKRIVDAAIRNDWTEATKAQLEAHEKIKAVYIESNPAPAKAILHMMGKITSPELRLPMVQVSKENYSRLENIFGGQS